MRIILMCLFMVGGVFANPTVSNIRVSQRENTKLVDILYDVSFVGGDTVDIRCEISTNAGDSFDIPASSFSGDYGAIVSNGTDRLIVWNAGIDWNENYSDQMMVRITAAPSRYTVVDPDANYIIDNKTGLLWFQGTFTFSDFIDAVSNVEPRPITINGVLKTVNPRLPTYEELQELADAQTPSGLPYGHPFRIYSGTYWSSSIFYAPMNYGDTRMFISGFSFFNRDGTASGTSASMISVNVVPVDIDSMCWCLYVIDQY